MINDIECPYCGVGQEINHDQGFGYEEDTAHEQECIACEKMFVFYTSTNFSYEANKADCLNGSEHQYEATWIYPVEFSKMQCRDCEHSRIPTEEEMRLIEINGEQK